MDKISPVEAFVRHAQATPDKIFLHQPYENEVATLTYAEALDHVIRLSQWLKRYPDNSHIAILSLNCMHWFLTDLAVMLAGHVSIPIYPTSSSSSINQVLEHSGAACLFLGKMPPEKSGFQVVNAELDVVSMYKQRDGRFDWDALEGDAVALDSLTFPTPDDLATIVYTSGTTGLPKGVMINFACLAEVGDTIIEWLGVNDTERFISYLPLAHVAERAAVEMASVYSGAEVFFVHSLDTFNADVVRAQPTVFFGVPRIWIKFQQAIESKISAGALKTILSIPFIGKRFAAKLRTKLGLDNVKIAVSGAAALPKDIIHWYDNIGIPICEAYGMSESMGSATFNHPENRRVGSVGTAVPGCEIQIMENDEVAYRSPCLMLGYYKEPTLSEQTIRDGWLYTGDTGHIDEDGFVFITGRLKDLFKTQKGKYIAPLPIESELQPRSGCEQLCVIGANLIQPVVIAPVVEKPTGEALAKFEKTLAQVLAETNEHLPKHEKLSHWFLVHEEWTPDNSLITPTLKMRRADIESRYDALVRKAVNRDSVVQWLDVSKLD